MAEQQFYGPTLHDVMAKIDRIEQMLDALLKALAEEDEEAKPLEDLDGKTHERPRGESRGL